VGRSNSDSTRTRIAAGPTCASEAPLAELATGIQPGSRDRFCVITHPHRSWRTRTRANLHHNRRSNRNRTTARALATRATRLRRGRRAIPGRGAPVVALREAVRDGWDGETVAAALLGSQDPMLW